MPTVDPKQEALKRKRRDARISDTVLRDLWYEARRRFPGDDKAALEFVMDRMIEIQKRKDAVKTPRPRKSSRLHMTEADLTDTTESSI